MKKGLHLLGRKNQSLYDTNIKIPERDNVELVLDSESTVFESGTANVRARPTVKHHTFSLETFQGFAVPTPKVPDLPAANGPKINGTGTGDHSSSGFVGSVPNHVDEKAFVPPPPPSVAPPPPPVDFILPPPDFLGDLDPVALQPPSMPAPKPPSIVEEDLSLLKPPPMAPPTPPSTISSGSGSSAPVSSPPPVKIPERPKFAPPQPPTEKHHKTPKIPPPKPIRSSSVSTTESPPHSPAQPPQIKNSKLSTFNPQNKAKAYDPPKTTFGSGQDNQTTKSKQMLLLQQSSSVDTSPMMSLDGKAPQAAQLPKPEPKPVQELKKASEIIKKPELPTIQKEPKTEVKMEVKTKVPTEAKTDTVPAQSDIISPLSPPSSDKMDNVQINSETNKYTQEVSPAKGRSFSPLLDRKLHNLKANETKPSPTSPLALLKAAKEREKQKTTQSLSRQSSTKGNETSLNSSTVIPRSTSSVTPSQNVLQESTTLRPTEPKTIIQPAEKPIGPIALAKDQKLSADMILGNITTVSSPAMSNLVEQKPRAGETPSKLPNVKNDIPKQDLILPLLPPPPEFDDLDQIPEPPSSIRPPSPPTTKVPIPPVVTKSPAQVPAKAPAKSTVPAPSPPKLPPPDVHVKPKPPVQTISSPAPSQVPPNLSPNQATLLSILQKKMLEMDQRMAPVNESEHSSDDWSTALSDEDNKVPTVPQLKPGTKNPPTPTNKSASLDMQELQSKVIQKSQSTQVKTPPKNGLNSRHQYGMTFTIRPGTKQPITLVNKGNP